MKHNRYTKFFGWFAAATLLLTTSCKDDLFDGNGGNLSDEVTVSFTLAPEGVSATGASARRASGEEGENGGHVDYTASHISDGSKADVLIYAVYDENDNLLEQYGGHTDSQLQSVYGTRAGQTIKYVPRNGNEGGFPVKINLTLKRGAKYKIAFWAQSSQTKAYNTENLKRVEVIYSEIAKETSEDTADGGTTTPNNDEFRDAFCRVVPITAGEDGSVAQDVYLYRPLAQINVGASGYDYETAVRNANIQYKYSKIRINRVARYLDVVEDQVYSTTVGENPYGKEQTNEAFQAVDFGYAPIPAYVNMDTPPNDPSYTKYDFEDNNPQRKIYEDEEFLKVHLYSEEDITSKDHTDKGDDGYLEYASLSKYNAQDKDYLSETFKYLSMCYVLTASTKEASTVLDNVEVWLATDEKGSNEYPLLSINNVPAQRNWRTNIVGDLLTTTQTYQIKLDTDFAGEYSAWGPDWQWTGPLSPDLSVGAYYDGEADEIQISNVAGLLWLEKMVNGKYDYEVYDTLGNKYHFKHNGIEDPTTSISSEYEGMSEEERQALKARIMRATHQDKNPNNNYQWPTNNNFHFMGAEDQRPDKGGNLPSSSRVPGWVYPAKVRLMADLDLSSYKEKWIPIGFSNYTHEVYNTLDEKTMPYARVFCGDFDGGNHTIYNLSNKRFSASVLDQDGYWQNDGSGPYDKAIQWYSVGLFGMIGQSGSVSNLRLKDIDLYGYNNVGGIAGTLNGQEAFIYNCYVDGGTITTVPMYRGDKQHPEGRTFARGVYTGGIVGYLNVGRGGTAGRCWDPNNSDFLAYGGNPNNPNLDKYASVLNCDVRNLTLRGYRQVGGIIGALNNKDHNGGTTRLLRKFSGNNVTNVTIIADKFQAFNYFYAGSGYSNKKNAFGWSGLYQAWADTYIGGNPSNNVSNEYILDPGSSISGNTSSNVIITEFASTDYWEKEDEDTRRTIIDLIPLNLMPMLSSFFTDEVTLKTNFTGKHSAYKYYNTYEFWSNSHNAAGTIVHVPSQLPNKLSTDWITSSGNVGMYIESVKVDGNRGNGRSIVTVEDAQGVNDCVAYIGGRNHSDYEKTFTNWNKHETTISSVVFRGQPYAYTGICLAPTSSTVAITLNNVSVYDVYQTLALDSKPANSARRRGPGDWLCSSATTIDNKNTVLKVSNSNLRGYTNYGSGWKSVTFDKTVFERGANIKSAIAENIQTCEVKQNTTFTNCYFKAPYTINIADGVTVTFTNSVATAASNKNIELKSQTGGKIEITADVNGNAVVTGNTGN